MKDNYGSSQLMCDGSYARNAMSFAVVRMEAWLHIFPNTPHLLTVINQGMDLR